MKFNLSRLNDSIKEGALTSVFQLLGALLSMLTTAGLSRTLNVIDFGLFQTILIWVAIASNSALPGMNVSVTKGCIHKQDDVFYHAFKRSTISTIFCIIAIFSGTFILEATEVIASETAIIAFLVGVGIIYTPLQSTEAFLVGKRLYKEIRVIAFLSQTAIFIIVVSVSYFTGNVIIVSLSFTAIKLAQHLLLLHYVRQHLKPSGTTEISSELISEGWKYTYQSCFLSIAARADRAILSILSTEALAIYAIALILPQQLKNNTKIFLNIFIMNSANVGEDNFLNIIIQKKRQLFLSGLLLFSLSSLAGLILIPLLFDSSYHEATQYSILISLSLIMSPFTIFAGWYDQIFKSGFNNRKFQYFKSIFSITLLLILTPGFGIQGAVVSILIAELITSLLYIRYVSKL